MWPFTKTGAIQTESSLILSFLRDGEARKYVSMTEEILSGQKEGSLKTWACAIRFDSVGFDCRTRRWMESAVDYDFVIVGSGFGGSVAALRLTEKGYRVAVVEQGMRVSPEQMVEALKKARSLFWLPAFYAAVHCADGDAECGQSTLASLRQKLAVPAQEAAVFGSCGEEDGSHLSS